MKKEKKPSPKDFISNLKTPMPLKKKVKETLQNLSLRVTKRQDCCGHPGHPGC